MRTSYYNPRLTSALKLSATRYHMPMTSRALVPFNQFPTLNVTKRLYTFRAQLPISSHLLQTMPVHILAQAFSEGLSSIPYGWTVVKAASVFAVLYLLKWFFNGATNVSERNMHSKVIMVTVGRAMVHIVRTRTNV